MTIMHKHHIVPKHMGGSDDPSNIVELTVEDHAEAHRKLYEEHGLWQDKLAWKGLSGLIGKEELSKEMLKERGKAISAAKSGNTVVWNKGMKTGPLSDEHKNKIKNALKGKRKPEGHGDKISNATKNVPKSESHKENLRKARTGLKRYNNGERNAFFIPGNQPKDFIEGWI